MTDAAQLEDFALLAMSFCTVCGDIGCQTHQQPREASHQIPSLTESDYEVMAYYGELDAEE